MKKIIISALALLISFSTYSQSRTLPSINVGTLDGNSINIQEIENEGNPIVINF